MDVKETKEFISFLCKTGNGVSGALSDGKFDAADVIHLAGPLMALAPALGGITEIGKELKDMDPAEAAELKAHVAAELSLDPSHAMFEALAEQVIGAALVIASAIMAIVAAKKAP